MKKYKEDLSDMKDLYRDVLQNIQPVDYDKEDIKLIEEKIMREQEMFEISEVNSIKEDTFKEQGNVPTNFPGSNDNPEIRHDHLDDRENSRPASKTEIPMAQT